MDSISGINYLYRVVQEDIFNLIRRNRAGKCQIRKPVCGTEQLKFFFPIPVISLNHFQCLPAYTLISFDMESAGISKPEYSPILCNKCPLRPYHLAQGIHKTGSIPACKDYFNTLICKRSDRLDCTGIYPAGRIRDRPVNVGKERL